MNSRTRPGLRLPISSPKPLLGELSNLAGEGFNLSIHPANGGREFVAFFGELVGSSLDGIGPGAFSVEQFVQPAHGANVGIVHGTLGAFDDGDSFNYRCKLDGEKVVWKNFLADAGEWGRWREQYEAGDALTAYSVTV